MTDNVDDIDVPADWYPDAQGTTRWWDGQEWTEHVQEPQDATVVQRDKHRAEAEPEDEHHRRVWLTATVVGLLTFFLGMGIGGRGSPQPVEDPIPTEATSASGATSAELDQRETALDQRESDLTTREDDVDQREQDALRQQTELENASDGAGADTIDNGVYEVGVDVQPGRYKSPGPDDPSLTYCSYRVSNDEAADDIVASENSQGPGVVTLESGQYFSSENCQQWTLQ